MNLKNQISTGKKEIYKAAAEAFVKEAQDFLETQSRVQSTMYTYSGHGSWVSGNTYFHLYKEKFRARETELREFFTLALKEKSNPQFFSDEFLEGQVFHQFEDDFRGGHGAVFERIGKTIGWIAFMVQQID